MYMHIASHGDAVQMAKAIHEALALTKTPAPDVSPAAQTPTELGFDQKQVEGVLGHTGKVNGGVLQYRSAKVGGNHGLWHDSPTLNGCRNGAELPADR